MSAPIELLSIDAYGTIFDMGPVYRDSTQEILDRLLPGCDQPTLSAAWTRQFNVLYHDQTDCDHPRRPFPTIQDLTRDSLANAMAQLGHSIDAAAATRIWMDHLQRVPLYDDVASALATLRQRFRLILTSDSDEAIIGPALARYQLPFEHTFVSETLQAYKMARRDGLLTLALRRAEIDPARVVHIGDSAADLIAAERAGCRAIWLNRPGHPEPGRPAWRTIHSLMELADL